jgi:phosphoribosylformylglycinamidine synthase
MMPLENSRRGVAVACGMNPHQGDLDPYHMAINAVDEALRNLAVVGVPPDRAAILDNFSWGNPAKPEVLGSLVRAAQGCHDAAIAFRAPFVSGKDSLNNEFTHGDETITIPCTLLISAMGVLDDASTAVTMDLKDPESVLYLAGVTRAELGASHLHIHFGGGAGARSGQGKTGGAIPQVDLATAPATLTCAAAAVRAGLVRAAHDLSEGGLAIAMAEMAFSGGVGLRVDLDSVIVGGDALATHELLFSESPTRMLFEVAPSAIEAFEAHWKAAGVAVARIGAAMPEPRLVVQHGGATVVDEPLDRLKAKWQTPLVPHAALSST